MLSTNFTEETKEKINEVIRLVTESHICDFYSKRIPINEIRSYGDFQKIPFLTKQDIIEVPWNQRIYLPENEIWGFSFSSGTTKQKNLTIIPRSRKSVIDDFRKDHFKNLGISKVLLLWPPTAPAYIRHLANSEKGVIVIPGNVGKLEQAAFAAKELEISGIITTPTILNFFSDYAKKIDFDFTTIKWISLGGERISQERMDFIKKEFPKASVIIRFGSSEAHLMGDRCQHLMEKGPEIYHPAAGRIVEIVNERGETVQMGTPGEIIFTQTKNRVFPVIRYKTGDIGTLTKNDCPCGEKYLLTLSGRSGVDFLKFHGAILRTDAIEKALSHLSQTISSGFRMHVFEEVVGETIKPKLKLQLLLKEEFKNNKDDPYLNKMLQVKISEALRLTSRSNLQKLVEENIFLPLEIEFIDSWPDKNHKTKYIIAHF